MIGEVWELEMAELPELGGSAGFVQPKDITPKDGMIVKISEAPTIVPSQFKNDDGDTIMRCRVQIQHSSFKSKDDPKKDTKLWTMNNTSYRSCKLVFGTRANEWVGKKVLLSVVKQMVRNQIKDTIYGEPADTEK
jgi:hypothetical protein